MACAACLKDNKTKNATCSLCAQEHDFCLFCIKHVKKLAALACQRKAGIAGTLKVTKIADKAKTHNKQQKRIKKNIQECKKKSAEEKAYAAPRDAVIDPAAFGPSDDGEIQSNALHYVHVRANEIWKANPKLFNQTTACVTIIECGVADAAKRSVLLTSCVEGPNPLAELKRQAKADEILLDPDPIVHRVRHKLKPGEKKRGNKKPKDTTFIARRADLTPPKTADIDQHPDYASAEASMSKRNPKYTVTSLYPSGDPNETHAEQRAIAFANARGCRVIAQAPTIGCCDECRTDLGAQGLAKVPEERQSSAAHNEYRRKTLMPTLHNMNKT